MRKIALCALLLAAACSKKSGSAAGMTGSGAGSQAGSDVTATARAAHVNAGGMWMPQQMAGFAELFKTLGVEVAAEALTNPLAAPLAAVVTTGGCTASFVSPQGLIITNHHCVQGGLQFNATPSDNLVENGFLAKAMADEKSIGPSGRIWVAQAFTDVTAKINGGLADITDPAARFAALEKRGKEQIAACEKDRPELRCRLHTYFRGALVIEAEYLELRDVRLVYVPARSIGNYGGDIDNWAWPRHTGDYSFMRAYVGKDGKPAEYSKDNVPFAPKHWLKVSTAGLAPSDFVMVTGYPGSTNRLQTASELAADIESNHPRFIAYSKQRMALLDGFIAAAAKPDATEAQKATAIKAGVMHQGVQNYLEKYEGMMTGFAKNGTLAQKQAAETTFAAWVAADASRAKYGDALAKVETILAEARKHERADEVFMNTVTSSRLMGTALGLARIAEERAKADADRKPGYQARDMPMREASQKSFTKNVDLTIDRAMFKLALQNAAGEAAELRPWLHGLLGLKAGATIDDKVIDAALDRFYGQTKLADEKLRLELLTKGTAKQLKASKDPFIAAALMVKPLWLEREKIGETRSGDLLVPMNTYMEGLIASAGGMVAPDANSSLRVSFGTVRGYTADGAKEAYTPFTKASEILAKQTGKEPFDAPAALVAAIEAKNWGGWADKRLGEVPVNFLSDLDITNGNSGSPVLNGKGELVGLAFDGNIEGMSSDVVFDGRATRTITLDIRYMLWIMDTVDNAKHLLAEMNVSAPAP
ncbi:MAG: S46 family peptidase [Myxococcales bacterium]|nr:S46 family peptidase [Myxococcales bacterium]